MHIFRYLIPLLLLCTACRKEIAYDLSGRPILFSQGMEIETSVRSGSLSSLNGKEFGVRGYIYTNKWASEEALATPNSDWLNTKVSCSTEGICTYSPIKNWISDKNYAFFGYYPHVDNSKGSVSLSGPKLQGSPVLTYHLSDAAIGATNSFIGDPTQMFDVMYGSAIDANEASTASVEMTFKHCLFGVQVAIENFHETKAVVLDKLAITLNLKYRTIHIPLNGKTIEKLDFKGNKIIETDKDISPTPKEQPVTFNFITPDKPVTIESTLNLSPVDVSEGKHLLLIPQKGIIGQAVYRIKGKPQDEKPIDIVFENGDFKAGTRYIFDIQFIGDYVNMIIIRGTEWTDADSNIEFE